jgi:hypothetical protein
VISSLQGLSAPVSKPALRRLATHHAPRQRHNAGLRFGSAAEGRVRARALGPIRSHGRGHRFDTCRAHGSFPQVRPPSTFAALALAVWFVRHGQQTGSNRPHSHETVSETPWRHGPSDGMVRRDPTGPTGSKRAATADRRVRYCRRRILRDDASGRGVYTRRDLHVPHNPSLYSQARITSV